MKSNRVVSQEEVLSAGSSGTTESAERELVIEGVPTTRELALEILGSDEFRSGDYSTTTLAGVTAVPA